MARYWTIYYRTHPGARIYDEVNRYSAPCPGHVGDKQQSIGKFERWNKRSNDRKGYWLHWKFRGLK